MSIRISDHFTYKRLFRFVLPSIMMMIFTSIYGVIDGYFVSNYTGKTAFAAINLIMPFLMILGGIGFMIGTGGSALVARILGEGDAPRAERDFSMLVEFSILLGAVLSVVGFIFLRPISYALGATPDMIEDCVLYGRILLACNISFILQNMFQSFLITAEKPQLGLFFTVGAGLTNIVLDAVFVAIFRWGIAGAAIATAASTCVGGILPLLYFMAPNSSTLHLSFTRFQARVLLDACTNGMSELLSNISTSLVSIVYNFQLMRIAGENGVASFGVIMYVNFIFFAVFLGFSIGAAPIVSFHYGAGNHAELKNMFHKEITVMLIFGVLMTILAQVLARPLAILYVGYDAALCAMTEHAFHLFAFSFLLVGLNIFASGFFTALNNGILSAAVSFLRAMVFQMLFAMVLPIFLGVDGIWLAVAVAEFFAAIVSILFLYANRRRYHY